LIRQVHTRDKVEQYCDEVLSGEILTCEMVRKAVEKYRTEMGRIGKHDWPFSFSEHDAALAIAFFPMLLRHSVGEWAGQPFELSPWQQFILWNLFGWKNQDGTRRFRRLFLSVARKNGKSTFCAGLTILLAVGDGEPGAQVFVGATKFDQAKIIFDEADRMLGQSPHIAKHATRLKNNIAFEMSHSFIRPLGSDKPYDGLNPHAVFIDEAHALREHHRGFIETMSTGSGARTQPVHVIITTAGDEKSQLYHEEANYARGVITGDIPDNSMFAMIFELDKDDDPFADDFDVATLVKANPSYGISVKPEYLEQQHLEAKNKPQAKNRFIRYHGNRCVSSVEEATTAALWDAAAGELSDWMTADGTGAGVDLGGRDDLGAYALCVKFKTGSDKEDRPIYRYETKSVAFIATDTKRDLTAEPFRTWIEQGKLIVCDYVVTTLKEYLIEDCQAWGIQNVAYDPYQATQLAEELEQEGLQPVKMPQTHGHFNETICDYLDELQTGRFKPDQNDIVLRWAALNMCWNRDNRDRLMPDKKNSKEKIDPAVAMLMARRACNLSLPRCTGSLVL
jgi:phage terminase large subunit-like protein